MDDSQNSDGTLGRYDSDDSSTPESPEPLPESAIAYKKDLRAAIEQIGEPSDTDSVCRLKEILLEWPAPGEDERPLTHVYHALAHDYAEDKLSLPELDAKDANVVRSLQSIAIEANVKIFLALVWKIKEPGEAGAFDERATLAGDEGPRYVDVEDNLEDYEQNEREDDPHDEGVVMNWKVKRLHDLDGELVLQSMPLDEENWLEIPRHFEHDAEENLDGSMDDVGLVAKHWHRKAAVLIVPRDQVAPVLSYAYLHDKGMQLMTHIQDSITQQVLYWVSQVNRDSSPENVLMLQDLCRYYWTLLQIGEFDYLPAGMKRSLPEKAIGAVMETAVKIGNVGLSEEAATGHFRGLEFGFFKWFRCYFDDRELQDSGDEASGQVVTHLLRFRKGIATAIKEYGYYTQVAKAIDNLVNAEGSRTDTTTYRTIRAWVQAIVFDVIITNKPVASDIELYGLPGYMELIDLMVDGPGCLSRNLVTQLKNEDVKTPFFLQLLSLIKDRTVTHPETTAADTRSSPRLRAQEAARDAAQAHLRKRYQEVFLEIATVYLHGIDLTELDQPREFLDFIRNALEIDPQSRGGLWDICSKVMGHVKVDQVAPEKLEGTWMPVVQELPAILKKAEISLNDTRLQSLTKTVLHEYLKRYVGSRPIPYPDFKRSLIPCDCPDCEKVNIFLADPSLEVATFPFDDHSFTHVNRFLADWYRDNPVWSKDASTQAYLKTMRRKDDLDVKAEYLRGPEQRGMFVRKTTAQLKDREDEYEERRGRAREQFGKMIELKEVLGKGDHSNIMAALQSYVGDGDE